MIDLDFVRLIIKRNDKRGVSMKYTQLKEKLLSLFNQEKLRLASKEWGFFHEEKSEIKRLGYAVNLTEKTIEAAKNQKVDFLLTHHDAWPFVFGLKELCNKQLIEASMVHGFFHAPLDDAIFGTSASLAKSLGLVNLEKVMPYAEIYHAGVVGEIDNISFEHLVENLENILKEDIRSIRNNYNPIRKIAVAAGGGNMTNEMRIAADRGCDTYITGEYVLYSQQYAELVKMNLLVGSHTNTEILGVKSLAELLCAGTDVEMVSIAETNY